MKIITTDELRELIDLNNKYLLIDVRERDELKHGVIPTSKNIPLSEFKKALLMSENEFIMKYNFEKPLKSELLIVYCRTGVRACEASKIAISLGYGAVCYKESIWGWSKIDSSVKRY